MTTEKVAIEERAFMLLGASRAYARKAARALDGDPLRRVAELEQLLQMIDDDIASHDGFTAVRFCALDALHTETLDRF